MKKSVLISTMLFLTLFCLNVNAQMNEKIVEPTGLNALIEAVQNDFNTLGGDAVSNTKYILRRGASYPYSTNFNENFSLHVEAEEGDGPLPQILPVNTGQEAPRMFRCEGDDLSMTYINLDYHCFDTDGNHIDNAPLRVKGVRGRQVAIGCIFDGQRIEVSRMDGPHQTLKLIDCMIRNNYTVNKWDKGTLLSLMGHSQDSLIIEGSTIFNSPCQLFTHGDTLDYGRMAKNTIHNIGGLFELGVYANPPTTRGVIDFGATQELIIEDNIFYNVGWMGLPPGWADSMFVFDYNPTPTAMPPVFRNNNYYLEPDLAAANPDSAVLIGIFSPNMPGAIGQDGNISEPLIFENAPGTGPCKEAIARFFAAPDTAIFEELRLDDSISNVDVDFSYTGALSPTAGTTGGPLGAPRWDATTSAVASRAAQPSSFELLGNYPNPFNPSTNIRFNLSAPSRVTVKVYDTLGRMVLKTSEIEMAAGSRKVTIDGNDLASGVYFYQVNAQSANAVNTANGRMLLLQ